MYSFNFTPVFKKHLVNSFCVPHSARYTEIQWWAKPRPHPQASGDRGPSDGPPLLAESPKFVFILCLFHLAFSIRKRMLVVQQSFAQQGPVTGQVFAKIWGNQGDLSYPSCGRKEGLMGTLGSEGSGKETCTGA